MDFAIFLLWLCQRIVSGWLQLKFIALTDLYNCQFVMTLLCCGYEQIDTDRV